MRWPWQTRAAPVNETRSITAGGYTTQLLALREAYIHGATGLAELTATVQSCVSLWEHGLSLADVDGTDLLTRQTLALAARSLALRGEVVALVREEGLVICPEWDIATRGARPVAYRLQVPEIGGATTVTALAGEVLHVVVGSDPTMPWCGTPPLRRASLTASLLHELESALGEVFAHAPLGSQVLPYPEAQEGDLDELGRSFRGRRGRVLLRESVQVSAAGGPAPQVDWRPTSTSPDLSKAATGETLAAARDGIAMAFGVLPALASGAAQGPLVREAQRHLAQWTLQPLAELIAEEATAKVGSPVTMDVMRPLQAFDAGGRARAAATMVEALARAKEAGVDAEATKRLVNW